MRDRLRYMEEQEANAVEKMQVQRQKIIDDAENEIAVQRPPGTVARRDNQEFQMRMQKERRQFMLNLVKAQSGGGNPAGGSTTTGGGGRPTGGPEGVAVGGAAPLDVDDAMMAMAVSRDDVVAKMTAIGAPASRTDAVQGGMTGDRVYTMFLRHATITALDNALNEAGLSTDGAKREKMRRWIVS